MTLRHMRIFVEVCRTMNITRAAENLYLSQPAVSLAISELEDYYASPCSTGSKTNLYYRGGQKLSELCPAHHLYL